MLGFTVFTFLITHEEAMIFHPLSKRKTQKHSVVGKSQVQVEVLGDRHSGTLVRPLEVIRVFKFCSKCREKEVLKHIQQERV